MNENPYRMYCPFLDEIVDLKVLAPEQEVELSSKLFQLLATKTKINAASFRKEICSYVVDDWEKLYQRIIDTVYGARQSVPCKDIVDKYVKDIYYAVLAVYATLDLDMMLAKLNSSRMKEDWSNYLRNVMLGLGEEDLLEESAPEPKKAKKVPIKMPNTIKDLQKLEAALNKLVIGQKEAVKATVDAIKLMVTGLSDFSTLFFVGPTGNGKCFGKGTPIKMYDGSTKNVEDVINGDLVMGDDSTPREVAGVTTGVDTLYKITPTKGDSFVVNSEHILCLRKTGTDTIIEIPVKDYIKKSNTFKHTHKQYRVGVDYLDKEVKVDPYFVGLWIGDGHWDSATITTMDSEVSDYLSDEFAPSLSNMTISVGGGVNRCPSYKVIHKTKLFRGHLGPKNMLIDDMRHYGMMKVHEKFIPKEYLRNSKAKRLDLLAGLIDSDGHLNNNCFEFSSKYLNLAEQVVELSRSVGLAAYRTEKLIKGSVYYRVMISGDVSIIPTKIERKQAAPRKQKKNVLNTGFSIESLGSGDYYGFTVDKNHRFLLGDFTVTHNTRLAKVLSDIYYKDRFFKVNCGEYSSAHEYAKLIGSPPGYIGHTEKSVLTEKAEKSNSWIFLFDEIEKAHPKFYDFLLNLLDEGKVTDSNGNILDFSKSIFIFTSNKGMAEGRIGSSRMGFGKETITYDESKDGIRESIKKSFSPEFLNRIDKTILFNQLNKEELMKVAKLELAGVPVKKTKELLAYLLDNGHSEEYGGRHLAKFIKNNIAILVAEAVLEEVLPASGNYYTCKIKDNKPYLVEMEK